MDDMTQKIIESLEKVITETKQSIKEEKTKNDKLKRDEDHAIRVELRKEGRDIIKLLENYVYQQVSILQHSNIVQVKALLDAIVAIEDTLP